MKHKTKTNLVVDIIIFVVFLIVYEVKATGKTIHEWIGIAIGLIFIVHIILHWKWLVSSTKQFLTRLKTESRLNYILDIIIYVGFTTIIYSGIMISESFLPTFGIKLIQNHYWKEIHFVSVDITLFFTAIHFALHWKWIVNNFKRYIITPLKSSEKTRIIREHALRRSNKSLSSYFSGFVKVSYQFFLILVLSGLISFGWYTGSKTISSGANAIEYSQIKERNLESRFKMNDSNRSERFGNDNERHRSEGGHHDEKGFLKLELLKNLLIFSIVTFIITKVSRLIKI